MQADFMTLQQAKDYLSENWEDGTICPCCRQNVKLYKRKITSAMAYGLILLVKKFPYIPNRDSIHIENFLKDVPGLPSSIRGDIIKLKYWDLITPVEGKREDGSPRNGRYYLNNNSYSFVYNQRVVPKYVYLYNKKRVKIDKEYTTIKECLGDKFNYNELVQPINNKNGELF